MYRFKIIFAICFFISFPAMANEKIAESAAKQIGVTVSYDPQYVKIRYPNGDVAPETGVCADVVIRALREQGIDLQKEIHEDMKQNFSLYPKNWGLTKPDTNIDHRRVPNMQTYFKRHIKVLPNDKDFKPGDIVTWNLKKNGYLPHIGIIAKEKTLAGVHKVIHNIGQGTKKEDILFDYQITGHYRY